MGFVATRAITLTFTNIELLTILHKFFKGDYGFVEDDSIELNKISLERNNGTVMGIYKLRNKIVWIIRDMNGDGYDVTTVLFPDEY